MKCLLFNQGKIPYFPFFFEIFLDFHDFSSSECDYSYTNLLDKKEKKRDYNTTVF